MTYYNPVGHMGYRALRRRARRRRHRRRDRARPPARRARRLGRRRRRRTASRPCCSRRPPPPTTACVAICERSPRLRLRRLAHGRHRRARGAREPGRRDGPPAQGGHRQAGAARRRHLQRRAGGRGVAVRRRRDRRQRARRPRCCRAADPTPRTRSSASCGPPSTPAPWRPRDQVPRVEAPAGAGARRDLCDAAEARTALDLFTGTTRVAQAFKRAGAHVTAVDTARYAEVFARMLRRDRRARRSTSPRARDAVLDDLNARPGSPGTSPRRSACGRASSSRSTARASTRSATRSSATTRGTPLPPDPAHQPHRGGRPGRLHDRRADGVREAVGAALVPRRSTLRRARAARRAPAWRVRGDALDVAADARAVRPRLPRPAVQPAPLLHELPRVGDARRVGRARALRRRVQARRRARRRRPRACSTADG